MYKKYEILKLLVSFCRFVNLQIVRTKTFIRKGQRRLLTLITVNILTPSQESKNTNQRLSRACIVHLVIKKTNWSYVKTMSCSGSHLGITINIKNTKFVKDLPMIDAQFRFNQCNSFREEYISVFSPYGSVLIL